MNGLNKDLPHYCENYGFKCREHQSSQGSVEGIFSFKIDNSL